MIGGVNVHVEILRIVQQIRDGGHSRWCRNLHLFLNSYFAGRINGVTRFGLFITLEESGADGLVPIGSLPGDYYHYEEAQHRLVGRRTGRIYRLGDPVTVRLAEANQVTGGLILKIIEERGAGGSAGEASRRRTGSRQSPGRGGKQDRRRRR